MKNLSLLLLCPLFLSGCFSPTENRVVPGEDAPSDWVAEPLNGEELIAAEELAVWWTLFEDEQLTFLVQRSLDSNLNLAVAAARVEEALALAGVASGARYPQVNGNAGLTANRLSDASGGAVGDREFTFSNLGLSATWELDLWGRVRHSVEAADAATEARIEDFRGLRALIAAQVVSTYVTLRELQLRQRLAEENIERQRETLKLTRSRFDVGVAPRLDVDQAEVNLARTEAILPSLRQRETAALRALEVLAGLTPGSLMEELSDEEKVPLPERSNLRDLPANVIRRRPDLRAAERNLFSAAALAGVAQAELYPRISLTGSLGWETKDSNLFDGNALTYSVGGGLLAPIFQGGSLRANADAAEARALQAELSYRQQVLEALQEVENALTSYRQESLRHEKLLIAEAAAESTVLQVRSLYENGLVTFLNVIDSERNLAAVQDEAAASLGQSARNLVGVYRAFGGGWNAPEFEDGEEDAAGFQFTDWEVWSNQTAELSLVEVNGEGEWVFRVNAYDMFMRNSPESLGMVEEVTLSAREIAPEVREVLDGLMKGERVMASWQETAYTWEDEVRVLQIPVEVERISPESP